MIRYAERPCDDCGDGIPGTIEDDDMSTWVPETEAAEVVRNDAHLVIHVGCMREGDEIA